MVGVEGVEGMEGMAWRCGGYGRHRVARVEASGYGRGWIGGERGV